MTQPTPADPSSAVTAAPLAQTVGRLASRIASKDFPTGERAALKRLDPGSVPSLAFYRFAFRYLPDDWERRQAAWMTLIAGLALMCPHPHRADRPAGKALVESGYAETRLERLLAAEGETLRTLTLRAARFLAAKNDSCNWTDFAYLLGLAGDSEKARLSIARPYYRNLKDKDKE